jgi:hypothetical protein
MEISAICEGSARAASGPVDVAEIEPERPSRRCGTCRVCCRLPELPALGKPLDVVCRHVNSDDRSEAGCSVFGSAARPQVCGQFKCGWLLGLGGENDRPDKLGVLMQPTVRGEHEQVLAFVEDQPGALNSSRVQARMWAWGTHSRGPVVVRKSGATNFLRVPLTVDRVVVRPGLAERVGVQAPATRDEGELNRTEDA